MDRCFDIIIVGAGPAGCAAALQLTQRAPELAARTLLVDGAVFPRHKPCGGGLVPQTDRLLTHLGIPADVQDVTVRSVFFHYAGGSKDKASTRLFRVVRRDVFDASLLRQVKKRGVHVREGEWVSLLTRERESICLETPRGRYHARVVIGADGARSRVRRALVGPARGEQFVALETLMADAAASDEAIFDFRLAAQGLRGYAWDFPCIVRGERYVNRGIGGSRWPSGISLRDLFAASMLERGFRLERSHVEGWSAPLYHPDSPQGAPGVLLAGDAVGVDPWLGEGISVALGTGILAAHAAADGLAEGCLDFSDHTERVRESAVGWQLERSLAIAEPFYEAAGRTGGLAGFFAASP
ncbi:FAD-dependent monooxygenase [Myxococcota bacterium]|nr:FAD-dependent monooxygenase [Myxococcota bacterium]